MKIVFGIQLVGLVALFLLAVPRDDEYRKLLASINRLDRQVVLHSPTQIDTAAIRDLKVASDAYLARKSKEYNYLLIVILLHAGITVLTPIKANLIKKK